VHLRFAPRYEARILELLEALDDRGVPVAEVNRRVGDAAEKLGLIRPSYVHLRRILLAERDRQDAERARRAEIRKILADTGTRFLVGLRVDAYEVADRIDRAGR
jgi:hypothetical protein